METQKPSISPLRQRMIEDMRMRKLGDRTQEGYVRAVRYFAKYLGRSPDTATVEDLRNYQLYLVDHGASPTSLNAAICGLKLFFTVTLDRPELMAKMQPVHLPRKLPVILSLDEVKRLIAAAGNLKHQTALALTYATGLRISEVVSLKVADIDSQRMTLRVEQGKGQKDRYAMLSPLLLERLRVWWRVARAGQDARWRLAVPWSGSGPARMRRSATTPAAIDIARSARRVPPSAGSRPDRPICCPSSTTTSSSPCPNPSAPSPTPTRLAQRSDVRSSSVSQSTSLTMFERRLR